MIEGKCALTATSSLYLVHKQVYFFYFDIVNQVDDANWPP